jgi:predicted ATPase/class 3 adenylate cyclase
VTQAQEPGGAAAVTPTARPETVTLLFVDMEGSTALLTEIGETYAELLNTFHELLSAAVVDAGGAIVDTEGDGLFAAFPSGAGALKAAITAQRALDAQRWPADVSVSARMGVHTGEALHTADGYVGLDVHRAARIAAAAHGGQVIVSESTRVLAGGSLPEGVVLQELGPHRLKDLGDPVHLYQLTAPGLAADFPPLRSLEAVPNNLPTELTSFVGREDELAQGVELLAGTRLLTLTGPGGTGKTRLGLQIAAEVTDDFADGVWFVALAPISVAELVPTTVLKALDVPETVGVSARERLLDHLADRELLLVLDNFEQILDAAALVADILRATSGVKVLATSRAPLHVSGEQEMPVPPLDVPDPDRLPALNALSEYESIALFVQRAAAVKPGFVVTDDNAAAVAAICAQLDGLPLAIELAAARIKLLSPEAILSRLEGRLALLSGGARDLPERQQTLRGAIDWSYDLLDDDARRLFNRLSVFVGGCTVEHAEGVCADAELGLDVLDGMALLLDHSLLRQTEREGEPRFWMLATIREYAAERLEAAGEADEIRRRHARTYLALAEEAAGHLTGPDSRVWLDRLEAEIDNFRAAEGWAVRTGKAEIALRLPTTVWRYFHMRGHVEEGQAALEEALALATSDDLATLRAEALEAIGSLAYWSGDMVEAERWYRESLDAYEALGDPAAVARALYNLSFPLAFRDERVEEAEALLARSLAIYTELGDTAGAAWVRWNSGYLSFWKGEFETARAQLSEALTVFREVGDEFGVGWGLHNLGQCELADGNLDVAEPLFTEGLGIFHHAQDQSGILLLIDDFAKLAAGRGEVERAVRLTAVADTMRQRTGADMGATLAEGLLSFPDPTAGLDPELVERLRGEGQRMSTEEAVAYALGGPEPTSS